MNELHWNRRLKPRHSGRSNILCTALIRGFSIHIELTCTWHVYLNVSVFQIHNFISYWLWFMNLRTCNVLALSIKAFSIVTPSIYSYNLTSVEHLNTFRCLLKAKLFYTVYIAYTCPCVLHYALLICSGVATTLENLEYSGISLNMENSGNSQWILCNLREKL